MAYIGQAPFQEFTSAPSKDVFTGDGSTTTFDLATEVVSAGENSLEVFVNNVRQEPGTGKAFTLGNDGSNANKRITFTAAPANGASIYVLNDKTNLTAVAPTNTDMNGVELILDADADTSITADTDDRIDFKIANVEHFSFSNSSGDTIVKPMTDAKDIKFQQYDGRTLLDINDGGYIGIANGATGGGEIRLYEDTDLGSHYVGFKAGNNTASVSYTLPLADGSAGYQLQTDGGGTLSWQAGTLALANDGNNRIATGTGSGGLNAEANLTFDGSTLTVTGATQNTGAITVGVDGTGHDVKFFGGTSGAYMLWDEDVDDLILTGAARLVVPEGQLVLGSTAVTTTPAELNLIDGGTARGTDAVATGDGILITDAGTMKMTNVDTVSTYFASHNVGGGNIVTTGALNSGSITSGFGTIDTGSSTITTTGDITGGTFAATTDTAAGDNASIGYTAAEGLILTGQGSTSDITIKNDADADVLTVATGTTTAAFAGTLTAVTGTFSGVLTGTTVEATADTSAGDNAAIGYTAGEGLILTGQGSTSDVVIKNDADATVFSIATGTTTGTFAGTVLAKTATDTSNTGSVTLGFTANQNFVVTVTGNVTLANPSTEQVGQSGFIACIQDGTGSRTLSLGTDYETAGAAGITLTTTASATDLIPYLVVASNRILLGTPQLAFA